MQVTSKAKIDLQRPSVILDLHAVQGDTARVLTVSLYEGNTAWTVPTGATVLVRFRKPDGTGGTYDTIDGSKAYSISGNTVTVALAPQVLTVSGKVDLQVAIVAGEDVLSTFTIILRVQADPSIGTVPSEDYTNLGEWILPQAIEAAQRAMDAATMATTAAAQATEAATKAELLAKSVTSRMDLTFEAGSIGTSDGLDNNESQYLKTRIRSGYFPVLDDTVSVVIPNTVRAQLVFYDENLVCLEQNQSSGYFTGSFDYTTAEADAKFARLLVSYVDGSKEITDVAAMASMITVYFPIEANAGSGGSGADGEDGGYYTPSFDQVSEDTVKVSFAASKNGMATAEGATLKLPAGPQGVPGYTPVRGMDYWTEEDQAAMRENAEAFITGELAKRGQLTPEFANSTDECADTSKLYVLPDGYIYAYVTQHTVEKPNMFDQATAKLNYRLNSSGVETALNGALLLDTTEVALADPYIVKISGVTLNLAYNNYVHVTYLNASKARLGAVALGGSDDFTEFKNGSYSFNLYNSSYAAAAYVRLVLGIKTEVAITAEDVANLVVEFEPKNVDTYTEGWANTGHAFVPADYEGRIVTLEEQTAAHAQKLANFDGSDTAAVPGYWQDAVDTAVAKVKALQDEGGREVVNFIWFSDMHYAPGNVCVSNIGTLCAAVMDACDIPLALMCGDTMSAAAVASEDILLSYLEGAANVLAPIGHEGLMQLRGNHDDVYGSYVNGSTAIYYVNKVAPEKLWNRLHRAQHRDFRRVFGGDGSYFYLDTPQKVRFVCLNSHFYDGEAVTGGTTGAMTSGFGEEQLDWLETTALTVEEGWSVVIATHIPPTAQAVNGNTGYLAQLSDGEAFRNIISGSTADIIGIFCGHCHADAIVSGDLPCPVLTVTCATNTPYDGTAANRVSRTATETAIDIVSINKATRTVSMTRLGAGGDRTINY